MGAQISRSGCRVAVDGADLRRPEDGRTDMAHVRSHPSCQHKNQHDDQQDAENADTAMTKTVAIAAEAATEATEQENNKDNDENGS